MGNYLASLAAEMRAKGLNPRTYRVGAAPRRIEVATGTPVEVLAQLDARRARRARAIAARTASPAEREEMKQLTRLRADMKRRQKHPDAIQRQPSTVRLAAERLGHGLR